MKTRGEIKSLAKEGFKAQYGTGVLLYFFLGLVTIGYSLILMIPYMPMYIRMLTNPNDIAYFMDAMPTGAITFFLGIASWAVSFLMYALTVNVGGAYSKLYEKEQVSATVAFTELSVNFWRKVGGMLWMSLFIFLWSLLCGIPGIVKAYSYRLTPYILSRHPNVNATEALNLSKRMTAGHKGKLFMLDLSFIGWYMLSGLTFGILAIFWVVPYHSTADGGYFIELRNKALENGTVSHFELGMEAPALEQQGYNYNVPPPPPPMPL